LENRFTVSAPERRRNGHEKTDDRVGRIGGPKTDAKKNETGAGKKADQNSNEQRSSHAATPTSDGVLTTLWMNCQK
jgi:hypothetical protein